MTTESLKIILKIYLTGNISEDEAIRLIEDLYSYRTTITVPYWPITYPSFI